MEQEYPVVMTTPFVDIDIKENPVFSISDWARENGIPFDHDLSIRFQDTMIPPPPPPVIVEPEPEVESTPEESVEPGSEVAETPSADTENIDQGQTEEVAEETTGTPEDEAEEGTEVDPEAKAINNIANAVQMVDLDGSTDDPEAPAVSNATDGEFDKDETGLLDDSNTTEGTSEDAPADGEPVAEEESDEEEEPPVVVPEPIVVDDKVHLALMIFPVGTNPIYDPALQNYNDIQPVVNDKQNAISIQIYNMPKYDPSILGSFDQDKLVIYMHVYHHRAVEYGKDFEFVEDGITLTSNPTNDVMNIFDPIYNRTMFKQFMCEDNAITYVKPAVVSTEPGPEEE